MSDGAGRALLHDLGRSAAPRRLAALRGGLLLSLAVSIVAPACGGKSESSRPRTLGAAGTASGNAGMGPAVGGADEASDGGAGVGARASAGGTPTVLGGSGGAGGREPGTGGSSAGRGGSGGSADAAGLGGNGTSGAGSGTGGSANSAGGEGGGAGASPTCEDVASCGGDVLGTWKVTDSCLIVSGVVPLEQLGIGCGVARVTGSLTVTGTWSAGQFNQDTDETTTTGSEELELPASCLLIAGATTTCDRIASVLPALGYAAATCTTTRQLGCSCLATVNQQGGMAAVSPDPTTNGTYTLAGDVITTDNAGLAPYDYCVSGRIMTMSFTGTELGTVRGTITLERQ